MSTQSTKETARRAGTWIADLERELAAAKEDAAMWQQIAGEYGVAFEKALAVIDATKRYFDCWVPIGMGEQRRLELRNALRAFNEFHQKPVASGKLPKGHDPGCPMGIATGAAGVVCEHGFDVCPRCDRCTCVAPSPAEQK